MTETDKTQVLESYEQQLAALCKQRDFSDYLIVHYARQICNYSMSDDFLLGERERLADLCRQFLKFCEMYDQVCKQVSACSSEISVIKDMK